MDGFMGAGANAFGCCKIEMCNGAKYEKAYQIGSAQGRKEGALNGTTKGVTAANKIFAAPK